MCIYIMYIRQKNWRCLLLAALLKSYSYDSTTLDYYDYSTFYYYYYYYYTTTTLLLHY